MRHPSDPEELQAMLESLLQAVTDGAAVFNDAGILIASNEAAHRILVTPVHEEAPDPDAWDPPGFFDGVSMAPLLREQQPERRALHGEAVREVRLFVRNDELPEGEMFAVTARPIMRDEKIVGSVAVYRDIGAEAWAEEELRRANTRLESYVAKLESGAQELALITEMGDFLQSCVEMDEFNETIKIFAHQVFPEEPGGVYLLNEDRTEVRRVASWGEGILSEDTFLPEECWAMRRGRVHARLADGKTPKCRHIVDGAEAEYICLPMMALGDALGILHVRVDTIESEGGPHATPNFAARRRAMTSVAEHIAGAFANLTLRETLRRQATLDPLTKLFNRRYLHRWLNREAPNAVREDIPMSMVIADLDHFKHYNDTYGHAAADEVLKATAEVLNEAVGELGIAARYGGEELAMVLKGVGLEEARLLSEKVCAAIRALNVKYEGQSLGQVTASLGVAEITGSGTRWEETLKLADEAMYRAKEAGRDRVEIAAAH